MSPKMVSLLEQYERFLERFDAHFRGDVCISYSIKPVAPPSLKEIQHFEQDFSLVVSEEIKLFWLNYRYEFSAHPQTSPDQQVPFFSMGFDFYSLAFLRRDLPDYRVMTEMYLDERTVDGDYWLEYYLHRSGLPLSYSEPQLVADLRDGFIYWQLYDGEMPLEPISSSFTEWFEHYLTSGCFGGHSYQAHRQLVLPVLPDTIPLGQNPWLQFYQSTYPQFQ